LADFNEAIRINPKFADAYADRGDIYSNRGEYDRAILDFNAALQDDPKSMSPDYNRAITFEKKHEWDRALDDYNEAIKLHPRFAEALENRGNIYDNKGMDDRALADLNQAIEIAPKLVRALIARGWFFRDRKQYDRAIQDFNAVIAINPTLVTAYRDRGGVYLRVHEPDQALQRRESHRGNPRRQRKPLPAPHDRMADAVRIAGSEATPPIARTAPFAHDSAGLKLKFFGYRRTNMVKGWMRAAALAVLVTVAGAAGSASAAEASKDGLAQAFHQADQTLETNYARLRNALGAPRQDALQADESSWLDVRDRRCGRRTDGDPFVDLTCATTMTQAHARFLAGRYRQCVQSSCSDLDFYNTQDVARPDQGPTLTRYPTTSKYHGPDAGYIAVYAHDSMNALYSPGGNVYVVGFIRLRGHYEGRVFQPEGYETKDISADSNFKQLTESLFPGHSRGTWAGGDTGGFVENCPSPDRNAC
jgi:tetratricopeptide (TPR) repeat protein